MAEEVAIAQTFELLASAARTSGPSNAEFQPSKEGWLWINVDTIADTPSITAKLNMIEPVSGEQELTIWTAAAAITATGTYVYYFTDQQSPTAWSAMTEVDELQLPPLVLLEVTHGDSDSITYSAGWINGRSLR